MESIFGIQAPLLAFISTNSDPEFRESPGNRSMLDALFLAAVVAFFVGSVAYAHFCERA
jgi:hypothetical protein